MCVLHMSSSPSYIVKLGRFGACIFGNHQEPSLHGGMQSLENTRPERSWGRCGRTLGSSAGHSGGLLVGPRSHPRWYSA